MTTSNNDWQITVNFNSNNTPIEARQGQASMGFYKVRCGEAQYYPPTDDGKKPFVRLRLNITESAHDAAEVGNVVSDRVNVPTDAQSTEARAWTERFLKATLIGLGHDRGGITSANGGINLGCEAFLGREGYLHYEPYNAQDKSSRSNITWVSVEQYERGVKGEFKVPLKNAQPSSIDTPAPAISASAGFTTASNGGLGGTMMGSATTAQPTTGIESLLA